MFVIRKNDPVEYFEQMDAVQRRMVSVDGQFWVLEKYSEKLKDTYYEYHFSCEKMDDIVGQLHFSE